MNKNQIAVIGDSHAYFFSGHEDVFSGHEHVSPVLFLRKLSARGWRINTIYSMTNFRVFHLGPALAYNLNKYGTSTLAREKTEFLLTHGLIAANQPVMCSFGEIDCRVHVLRYVQKTASNSSLYSGIL